MENEILAVRNTSHGLYKTLFFKLLAKMEYGNITLIDNDGEYQFTQNHNHQNLSAILKISNKAFYRKIVFGGSNGAAESFIDGDWQVDSLTHLIEIVIKNEIILKEIDQRYSRIKNSLTDLFYRIFSNTRKNSKKNILSHYDLGNKFFATFLDETMMYSAAIYTSKITDLKSASLNKLKIICDALELKSTDHLLEIGSGWGGLAIYAAENYGCQVTTTTISDKQYQYINERISHLKLQNKVTVLKRDYRDLSGSFDKLVSIEMLEAVGHQYFNLFFEKCNSLLKTKGLMFLQTITINEKAYQNAKNNVDFIKKYIFPGGCLPSLHAITRSVATHTDLQLLQLKDIGEHYVKTLMAWKINFNKSLEDIKEMGFSEAFIRMWNFYFSYCIAGFKQQYIGNLQCLWQKRV